MEAEGILFYSRSISSRERPVHFWMIIGVIPSAFILRAVDSFPFCSPFSMPSSCLLYTSDAADEL